MNIAVHISMMLIALISNSIVGNNIIKIPTIAKVLDVIDLVKINNNIREDIINKINIQ